jgi:hypothetical protein
MMKYALNLVILENRMATSIDCQELQVDNDHHHQERDKNKRYSREKKLNHWKLYSVRLGRNMLKIVKHIDLLLKEILNNVLNYK